MGRILIVDDEPNMRRILASHLRQDKHEVTEASGVEAARTCLAAHDFDVVFTDQRMPDGDGLDVLAAVKESNPTISVVFLTAIATIQLAVDSMRQGAFDFLTKPFQPGVVCAAAPDRIVARGKTFPNVTRPLCPYPQVAHWDGSGRVDDAAAFQCAATHGADAANPSSQENA